MQFPGFELLTNTVRKSKERFLQLQLWFVLVFIWGLLSRKREVSEMGGKLSLELRYHSDLLLLADHQVKELYPCDVISVHLSCLRALISCSV